MQKINTTKFQFSVCKLAFFINIWSKKKHDRSFPTTISKLSSMSNYKSTLSLLSWCRQYKKQSWACVWNQRCAGSVQGAHSCTCASARNQGRGHHVFETSVLPGLRKGLVRALAPQHAIRGVEAVFWSTSAGFPCKRIYVCMHFFFCIYIFISMFMLRALYLMNWIWIPHWM